MHKTALEHSRALLFFLITALLFLWPLSFQLLSFKNDALTYYYPVRTLISDALQHAELPLWTPYINMGYPLHADFQSGAWNPFVWLFGFATGYPLAAMHYECILYFSLAGMGMYLLAREFGASTLMAGIVGISFQFSGFMIDSIQFFTCISSVCWIPYIYLYFVKTLKERLWKNPALLSLFLAFLLLCGYPAFLIITGYLLLLYLLFFIWQHKKQKISWLSLCIRLGFSLFLFLLLCAPALMSYYQHLPYISRGGGQTLEIVQQNSMNPATTLSLLFPFSAAAPDAFLHSELLMRTIYIGVVPLSFLLLIIFQPYGPSKRKALIYIGLAIAMLLMAFGKHFFFRELAFDILPGMDMFRHPGLFRVYFIFFSLLAILTRFPTIPASQVSLKKVALILSVISGALLLISIYLRLSGSVIYLPFSKPFFNAAGFWQRIGIESLFVIFISLLIFWTFQKWPAKYILVILVLDLFVSTQIHLAVTGVGAKSYSAIVASLNRNPTLFPIPESSSIAENSIGSTDSLFEAGSRMPFRKLVGRNAYFITPGNLKMQEDFYSSAIRDSIFKRPLISLISNKEPGTVTYLGANKIEGKISAPSPDSILLLQNHYPNWKAFVDGKEISISTAAICFMSIPVESGHHEFRFIYDPPYLHWMIWLPLSGLLIIFLAWKLSKAQLRKHQSGI